MVIISAQQVPSCVVCNQNFHVLGNEPLSGYKAQGIGGSSWRLLLGHIHRWRPVRAWRALPGQGGVEDYRGYARMLVWVVCARDRGNEFDRNKRETRLALHSILHPHHFHSVHRYYTRS
jgi:hypothetical protein